MAKGMNVLVAAAAGFVAGILLAPKSGEETRRELMDKANDAKRVAGEKAEHVKGVVKDSVDNLKSSAKTAGDQMSELASSAKDSASRMAGEAKDLSEEAKVRTDHVVGTARSNARGAQKSPLDQNR